MEIESSQLKSGLKEISSIFFLQFIINKAMFLSYTIV